MRYLIYVLIAFCFSSNILAEEIPEVSLRDKIGQMLLIGFDGKTVNAQSSIVKAIQDDNIGGVILFDFNSHTKTFEKNIANPTQVKKLNADLQYFTAQANEKHHRVKLPLLISVDYEGGQVTRLSQQFGFPATLSADEVGKRSFAEAEVTADAMAHTLKKVGFNLNFSPLVDVNTNANNPIIGKLGRSFSNSASTVTSYASIFTRHFLNQKIQCVYKHFPGHGSSSQDSHLGFVDVSSTWQMDELQPYQDLINADESCGVIMSAHIVNRKLDESGLPATLSYKMLTGLLRNQLQFKGVIISDDMQMKAISDHYGLDQALVLSINAGADMLIFGNNLTVKAQDPRQLVDIIEAKVLSGDISRERINDAYQHILILKQSLVNK